jgi:hypothetical protein
MKHTVLITNFEPKLYQKLTSNVFDTSSIGNSYNIHMIKKLIPNMLKFHVQMMQQLYKLNVSDHEVS